MVNMQSGDTSDLPNQFFIDWSAMADRLGIDPEHILMVSNNESIGVDPAAYNPGGAAGLIQFTPVVFNQIGWKGDLKGITKLSAVEQIPYVEKYYAPYAKYIVSPATAYLANAAPAILPYTKPDDMSAKLPQSIYGGNAGFDDDHKGYITLGDLDRHMRNSAHGNRWLALQHRLYDAMGGALGPDSPIYMPTGDDLLVAKKANDAKNPYKAASYNPGSASANISKSQQAQDIINKMNAQYKGSAVTSGGIAKGAALVGVAGVGIYFGYRAFEQWRKR